MLAYVEQTTHGYFGVKKLLQNSFICHSIGLVGTILTIHAITGYRYQLPLTVVNSFWLCSCAYILTTVTIPKITNYPLVDRKFYILPVLASAYCIITLAILLLRLDYSREVLIEAFAIQLIWLYISTSLRGEKHKLKLKAINNFDLQNLLKSSPQKIELSYISDDLSMKEIVDGLVVDLHAEITAEQEKFVADCSIHNIPVFHSESIKEMIEGKVQTEHLSANAIGTLLPDPIYKKMKVVWECLLIIMTAPITLPLMIITAILIKLEDSGPAIFSQERVGQGGKVFKIYKFRSMTSKQLDAEDKFATEEASRVTKIGKTIRKYRIDELPQFFNVLKGEMSLIGPRPEQESFVKTFEKDIPFYGYRHMVKPGITGWAQTVQGYADCVDSTKEKLAHDLYYIRHFSFWLDMNIVIKTIKTMVTGFGAK